MHIIRKRAADNSDFSSRKACSKPPQAGKSQSLIRLEKPSPSASWASVMNMNAFSSSWRTISYNRETSWGGSTQSTTGRSVPV